MAWSTNPQSAQRDKYGWSTNPAPLSPPAPRGPGWFVSLHELAAALSISEPDAALVVRTVAEARGISLPEAALLVHMTGQASSASSSAASIVERQVADALAASVSVARADVVPQLVAQALGVDVATALLVLKFSGDGSSASAAEAANAFPATAPLPQQFTAAGNYTYTIPYWCRFIDVVVLGGGGGGQGSGSSLVDGFGAKAGDWATWTLERGVDIAWTLATITGTVGNFGAGGNAGAGAIPGIPGSPGSASTAVATGKGTLRGDGGPGGALGIWGADKSGQGPGTLNYNGQDYVGGTNTANQGSAKGNPPGGGGAGAAGGIFIGTRGGDGAVGRVWFRAYQ
ncbi:minor tail protein [Mycobacterium phage BoostSeason]|nr:minor tail protein [Mycobacterium phage BoostSeason]